MLLGISETMHEPQTLSSDKTGFKGTGEAVCVLASAAVKTKEAERGLAEGRRRVTGSFSQRGGWAQQWAPQTLPCQLVDVPLCLSLPSASTPQYGSKPGNWVSHKYIGVAGRRAEAGGERRENRIEARAVDIHLNLGRCWGNVGHAYLRKHCWREGSIIAGSEKSLMQISCLTDGNGMRQ